MTRPQEQRLEDVVLGYALAGSKPRTVNELTRATARYRPDGIDAAGWAELVAAAVRRVQEAGFLDEARRPGPRAEEARARLGLPARADGTKVRFGVLPRLAMGVGADAARRLATASGWAAAIVAREQGLPATLTAAQLGNALVWRELGLKGKARDVPDEVRAYFLRRLLGESVGEADAAKLLRLVAAKAVGAPRGDSEALRDALVKRWVADAASTPPAQPTLAAFVSAVREAARRADEGRFGDRQVFISAVWRQLRANDVFGGLPLDEFKQRLVEAQRAGLLALAPADLVAVMDPALVAESETQNLEARYHFVLQEVA